MNKYSPTAFRSIDYLQHAQTMPSRRSPTTTFESLLPETQEKYYQPQRKEKEDAKQAQLDLIKKRETIQAALNARDKADEEIALITARQVERKRTKGLGLKKSMTMSDLTKYSNDEDPDPNKTWRDSERHGGRGTNLHSLGRGTNLHSLTRRRTRATKRRRTKQKKTKTKRRRTKSTRKKRRSHRSTRRRR